MARPLGMYRLHTRTPAQTALIALASVTAGSPNGGNPGMPICTSSRPTRDSTATPFHCEVPWWAT